MHIAARVNCAVAGPGIAGKPVIGSWSSVSAAYLQDLLTMYRSSIVSLAMSLFPLGTALIAFLYWRGKAERVEGAKVIR